MKAAKADRSGTFDHITLNLAHAPTVVRPRGFHLSPRGMTFRSDRRLAPWTEVEVEVEVPGDGQKRRAIRCAGIVVQCEPAQRHAGYDITLLFLELNKRAFADLNKISQLHTQSPTRRNAVVGFRV